MDLIEITFDSNLEIQISDYLHYLIYLDLNKSNDVSFTSIQLILTP
jgi:hypothetical protein